VGRHPGWLRARTGAHEVITTIMFNYIAIRSTDYLIKVPFLDKASSSQRTPFIAAGAQLPFLFGADNRLHAGFLIAIVAAVATAWILKRTIIGFEIRTTGANPDAAHYAGMNVPRTIILTMALSGLMAGLAGARKYSGSSTTSRLLFLPAMASTALQSPCWPRVIRSESSQQRCFGERYATALA
jgi:simple sugar transport system permease protein